MGYLSRRGQERAAQKVTIPRSKIFAACALSQNMIFYRRPVLGRVKASYGIVTLVVLYGGGQSTGQTTVSWLLAALHYNLSGSNSECNRRTQRLLYRCYTCNAQMVRAKLGNLVRDVFR